MSDKRTTQQLWDDCNYGNVELKKSSTLELYDRVTHGEVQPNWTPQMRRIFLGWVEEYQTLPL